MYLLKLERNGEELQQPQVVLQGTATAQEDLRQSHQTPAPHLQPRSSAKKLRRSLSSPSLAAPPQPEQATARRNDPMEAPDVQSLRKRLTNLNILSALRGPQSFGMTPLLAELA